ncbi:MULTISPECIES: AAA family ATPase [unclassified Francisella]|uniref:AAA family ATPase n=1 Tax=unclassified Francisella TaxID=2610885 RepID=UPI002E321685|nr:MULTISPECIES: AAA family ATPase [unclassified Francisella]MED7818419.1 AAA family ATPase [Francisella sp. 19S2-4]MED7829326.1 AAA family ATPase [Francisella sp. 19S2-10]
MKIESIWIKNWRSVKEEKLKAQDLMIIIGQNNHGKSNLLSSVLFFFGEIKQQDLDFYSGSAELFVEIQFGDLDESDKTTFKKYLTSEGKIIVRKTAFLGGSFEYKGYIENPLDDWLQEANASAYTKRELASSLPLHPYIPDSGRINKQDIVDAQNKYIQNNRENIQFTFELETTNFLGLKSVAKGIFGEVYFIPALKEASDDFSSKDSTIFGKMYADVVASMSEHNNDWKETKERLRQLFSTLNKKDHEGKSNSERPKQLCDFEQELTNELVAWGTKVDIEVTAPDIENVFKANTQVWVDDGVRTDIKRKGHGLQRALTVALIQVVAKKALAESKSSEEQGNRKSSNSRYFIFEEPELYLHPQAQRSLFDSFVSLSESGSQVILCTHSSSLIDVERYKSIYIATKDNEERGTKVKQCTEDLFEGDSKKDFNLSYWINPDRGELFFASKVVLLEGATEKTVFPLLAKTLGVFRYEYTLIDCGSKDSIPLYIKLMNKFSIPYIVVYDRDHQAHKKKDAIASANQSTQNIIDIIDANIGTSVVLENDIEEELGLPKGGNSKPYVALSMITSKDFKISPRMESKIKEIYS